MESVAEEVRVLRKDFEAKMLQPNERIASISDSVKVSSQSILKFTMKSAGGVSQDPHVCQTIPSVSLISCCLG